MRLPRLVLPRFFSLQTDAAGAERRLERAIAIFAALVCFFFVTTLRDVRLPWLPAVTLPAPPLPETVQRDAELTVVVVDEAERPLAEASVRAFSIQPDAATPGSTKTYFAGERATDGGGSARFEALPRGETWVLAYGPNRARASTRVVLDKGARTVKLVLRPASALDVVVVDEGDKPVPGAEVRVATGDPLPHVGITDKDGAARIDRLGPSPWVVRAAARGYEEATRSGVTPSTTPLRIRLEKLGALEVTVLDDQGGPAAGATVLAAGTGLWPARSTVADVGGKTRIAGLRTGVYDLKARAGDLVSATEIGLPLKRGEIKAVTLRLAPGRRVVVTVTDGEKTAEGPDPPVIKDASVALVEEGLSSFPLYGRTNDKGVVVLGPISPVSASVSARAIGFVSRSAVGISETATEVSVPLSRGGALVGDVKDDRGYPIAGATIEVVGTDAEGMPIDESSTLTDFRQEHFDFVAAGPRPLIPMGELGVMPGPVPDLPRDGFVPSGTPPPGGGGGEPWVTRDDGTFTASPIPPGRVHAIVRHPGYVEGLSETVTIKPGGTAEVHVVLRQGGLLEGRVVDESRRPIGGARVELAATQGSLERNTFAADDGTFAFAAVPSEVLISVSRPESPTDVAARVVVEVPERGRKEVEIVLPKLRDSVIIQVTDSRRYPEPRVEVRIVSLDVAVALKKTLFTNDDGEVELPDAVGLPLRFTLMRPTKAPRVEQVDAAPPKLAFELAEAVTGKGRVTGRGGRERLDGAEVTLYTASGVRRSRTNPDGEYVIDDLAPGRVRVAAAHEGYAPAERVMQLAADSQRSGDLGEIDLAEAGEVSGQVVDAQDQPVPGARVARDAVPTYLPMGPLPAGIVVTDREGGFTLRGLPEGEVTLEAYIADLGRGWIDAVPVRASRTTSRVKITLTGEGGPAKDTHGGGSVAVTLGERSGGRGGKTVVVVMVPPASEGEVAGIEPGDEILAVNGREVRSIEEARRRLTGPLSEDVVVTLSREGGLADGGRATWIVRVRRERVRR
jgi:hypothetical protein